MSAAPLDPRRLTLARWAAELTKRELAERAGVSPASISQYESGKTSPSSPVAARLALACGVPFAYLHRSPERRRPDLTSRSFFRSLRSTPQRERDRADALAEHVLDVVDVIERRVSLPAVNVPQISPGTGSRTEIEDVAAEVRAEWQVPHGPIANVVRLLEANGVVVARLMSNGRKLDAFSRWFGDRPLVVLWADKGDKARSRFDAAHELGHLVMHSDADQSNQTQEREANMFASAFLMPAALVSGDLVRVSPTNSGWSDVRERRARWGVSASALLYRSRELGALPESAFRRAMQNYARHGLREVDGRELGAPERPVLLARAADAFGESYEAIAMEAALPLGQVEDIMDLDRPRGASRYKTDTSTPILPS